MRANPIYNIDLIMIAKIAKVSIKQGIGSDYVEIPVGKTQVMLHSLIDERGAHRQSWCLKR